MTLCNHSIECSQDKFQFLLARKVHWHKINIKHLLFPSIARSARAVSHNRVTCAAIQALTMFLTFVTIVTLVTWLFTNHPLPSRGAGTRTCSWITFCSILTLTVMVAVRAPLMRRTFWQKMIKMEKRKNTLQLSAVNVLNTKVVTDDTKFTYMSPTKTGLSFYVITQVMKLSSCLHIIHLLFCS